MLVNIFSHNANFLWPIKLQNYMYHCLKSKTNTRFILIRLFYEVWFREEKHGVKRKVSADLSKGTNIYCIALQG